jgi:CHRD domain
MKRITIMAVAVFAIAGTALAFTDDGRRQFREFLNGVKEATAVVSTTGTGTFRATINQDETEINYVLTFQDLEGDVRQAHIHIGHPQNQGGIVLWLCDSATNPSPSTTTPECTQDDPLNLRAGRVTGTLTADDVQAQAGNGIAAGEFAEVIALIRAGRTYANVHSEKFTGGEIRSQIENRDGGGGGQGHDHQ